MMLTGLQPSFHLYSKVQHYCTNNKRHCHNAALQKTLYQCRSLNTMLEYGYVCGNVAVFKG